MRAHFPSGCGTGSLQLGHWVPATWTEGGLAVFQMCHAATSAFCRSIKLQCELYPSREVAICLDPYCGLGFVLWCLCR